MNEKKKRFEDECNKKIQDIENKKKELILQEMEILRHEQIIVLFMI